MSTGEGQLPCRYVIVRVKGGGGSANPPSLSVGLSCGLRPLVNSSCPHSRSPPFVLFFWGAALSVVWEPCA